MLKKEQFETIQWIAKEQMIELEDMLKHEFCEETEEELKDWTEIFYAMEAMKEMDWSWEEGILRRQNAVLRAVLSNIRSEAIAVVDFADHVLNDQE